MNGRSRWVGAAAFIGALLLILLAAGRAGVDEARPGDRKPGEFTRAGRFTLNLSRIDYVEQSERGQLYVYFTSKNSIVLSGDAAKALLHAMGADD
jgi:hypothetical protein